MLPRPPKLPPKADKRMKELLPPRPPKNIPPPRPPKPFQKDYEDTENDVSVEPSKLPLPPKLLPNGGKRAIEQDPPPRPPKVLPPSPQPDLPPKSPKSSLNKPAANGPLKV